MNAEQRRTFEELVATRGHALLRFTVMLCGDRHQAEDLLQAVLAKAYRRWSRVAEADRPEAYLKTMLVNEHLSWWRRRSNRGAADTAFGGRRGRHGRRLGRPRQP